MVLEHIQGQGEHGATCYEVECALELAHQTASPRITELRQRNHVHRNGQKRPTHSGNSAYVLVAGPGELEPEERELALYVWDFEGALAFVYASSLERARELVLKSNKKFDPDLLNEAPEIFSGEVTRTLLY